MRRALAVSAALALLGAAALLWSRSGSAPAGRDESLGAGDDRNVAEGASSSAPTLVGDRLSTAPMSDELDRLRAENRQLRARVAELERSAGKVEGSVDHGAATSLTAAPIAAETNALRQLLLRGNLTHGEARRFWQLLRGRVGGDGGVEPVAEMPARPREDAASPRDVWLSLDASDDRWDHVEAVADGARRGAASFHDSAAKIDAGVVPMISTEPFTFHAFVRTLDPQFATALIARQGEAVGFALTIGRVPGCVSFEAWSWRSVRLTSKTRVDDGRWHEIEVAYEPTTEGALLVVDGIREDVAILGPGESRSAFLRLGNNIGIDQAFHGDLDEVGLTRRLSHGEAFGSR